MSPIRPKLTPTLRLLRHPSQWKWLERFVNKAYFVPIHDCGDFTKFNGPEYWMDPKTGMPRSKMTKTGAFARYFFPAEAKRIEEIRKKNLAAKRALATAEALASEVKGQAEIEAEETKAGDEGAKGAREAETTKEPDTGKEPGEEGTGGSKKEDEDVAASASAVAGAGKTTS